MPGAAYEKQISGFDEMDTISETNDGVRIQLTNNINAQTKIGGSIEFRHFLHDQLPRHTFVGYVKSN